MAQREIRRLAVCKDDRLVGVLSHGSLVQAANGMEPAKTATEGVTKGA
jgi:signal-transduction protein with cAMP-binding, CBS, and nucleotidyltransferase domain